MAARLSRQMDLSRSSYFSFSLIASPLGCGAVGAGLDWFRCGPNSSRMPLEWRAGQDDRDVMGAVCTFPVFVIGWRCSAKRGRDNGVCDVEPLRFNRVIPGISSCMNRGCEFLKCGPRILCCEILLPDCHQPTMQLRSLQEFALYCELFHFASYAPSMLLCFLLVVGRRILFCSARDCDPTGAPFCEAEARRSPSFVL